jgi:hypothetical protein
LAERAINGGREVDKIMEHTQRMTAILPCNDLDRSEKFYQRLGFVHRDGDGGYRMLNDGKGGEIHLQQAEEGWLIPGRNPFGLYLYAEDVDVLAARMGCKAEDKPWGMYEFALSDPDETLVRVGWPSRLRHKTGGTR